MFEEGPIREKAIIKLHQLQEALSIHPEFLQVLDNADLDCQEKALQEEAIAAFVGPNFKKCEVLSAFVLALFELRNEADACEMSRCGDVNLSTAVDFCIPWKKRTHKYALRAWLLERTGFRHGALLAEQLQIACQLDKEYPYLDRHNLSEKRPCNWM